jgi:hypothetical protein
MPHCLDVHCWGQFYLQYNLLASVQSCVTLWPEFLDLNGLPRKCRSFLQLVTLDSQRLVLCRIHVSMLSGCCAYTWCHVCSDGSCAAVVVTVVGLHESVRASKKNGSVSKCLQNVSKCFIMRKAANWEKKWLVRLVRLVCCVLNTYSYFEWCEDCMSFSLQN